MSLDMEKYIKVRKAQAEGVRTVEELKEKSDIVIDNDTEIQEIEKILQNACKCKNVSVSEVVSAVKNGADTFEKVAETTTDSNGRYSFSGLKSGNYYVKYTFDCDKYTTTEKNKVDNTKGDTSTIDSDAEMMSGTCAAVSNIITLDNNRINSSNIDLGLRVRQVFDVSVNKYITNVTVTSNKGVESHDYDRKKQVRLDLRNLKNTSFKVVYTIEIENTKYFPGTVGNIIESIPDGMTFDPNLAENDGWYENDGLLYYSNLDSTLLMPGEKYYITIVLNLVTDSGGSYVNFVSVNDLQVQSVVSDLTDVKDENDFSSDTEDNSDIDSDTGNTGEGE